MCKREWVDYKRNERKRVLISLVGGGTSFENDMRFVGREFHRRGIGISEGTIR